MPRLFDSKQFRTDLQLSGSFSGSFEGSGANLTNIPASAIGGLNLSQIASGSFSASVSQNGGLSVNTDITASSLTVNGNILLPDGGAGGPYIGLGDAQDLKIFHNGGHSIVRETGVGSLYLQSDNNVILSKDSNTELMVKGIADGAVELYHDNVKKFETTADGIYITGSVTASGNISASSINAFEMNVTHFTASFITASTIQTSGSNIFGDESSDTHTFIGNIIAQNNISSSGYISGSVFSGDGSGLVNIPASGITGLNLSQIASGSVTASIAPDKGFQVNTNITASGNIRMQTAAPSILIQRTDNDNNASIDFIGQAGATGAQIQFSGSSNELTFGTYDGSSVIERLRIEDGTTPNIIITGSTNISGSATSTASFGTYIGDGNGLTNISSTSLNGISLGLSTVVGDGASSATSYGNAFGKSATSTGGQNVAVGAFSNVKAGGVSIGQSTSGGNYTVAIGRDVGNTNGEYNVLIGDRAGNNSSGDYNISLGYLAGYNQTSGIGNITIGSGSQGVAGESNQLRIGHGLHGATISGSLATGDLIFSNNVTLNGGTLSIRNKGAQSEARFYCEVSNAHYTALKAQPHALYSGNPVTLLPAYDFDFAKPHFQANITASGDISGSATSTASFGTYIGDGSGLTGLGGAFGISNSNGVYTYYGTLSASIAAASAGDVVEVFADVVETNPITILFKDGVNINGNGHTYTLDHSSSMAAFADYEAQETSGTSISCSIHNFNMRRINGDDSSVEFASTIYIHNDTAGADTFLDLRGSTIYSDNGYTYFCSYRHGRVQGGRFIGDRDGGAFQLNAPSNTHYPSLYDAVCDFSLGYAQVGSATNCTFISKGGIYGLQTVTGGDYKISNCSIYAQAVGRGSGAVQGVRIGNTANRLEDCYVSVGGTNNYGVYGATQMRGCTIESSGIGVFASGAGQNISNNRIHSTGHAAASLRTNYSSGTYIYANNTFTSDATSYSTVYYRGEVDTDGTFNNNSIYAEGDNANAHALQITVQANHDCHIYNNTFKVFNPGANCIYANGQDTAFLAGNIYETAGVAVHPNVTQSFTNVPDEQGNIHVTSSLDNSRIYSGSFSGSYVGDGSQLSGVSAFPFSGSAVITGSLIVSQSTVDFSNATSVTLPAATVPLINPQVEYVNCAAITASGATVPLPNGLTFISSSIYEYIEIFINGLRMRYDVDFAPRSTSTIQYFVTIPSGSEITYKSLNRP